MRAIVQLQDYDPEDPPRMNAEMMPWDDRANLPGIETEWYPGSGNVHIIDDKVVQVADMVSGDVLVEAPERIENERGVRKIENATLVTVYAD